MWAQRAKGGRILVKLIKCYVASFGKLNDFSYEFNQGLNTIKEDNGFGKSTLATFIKSMFYGLNDSKRNVADNERLKYRPWNSVEKFGGYIEFERGGESYKLERFFGKKESEDTLRLYDLKTGKVHENPRDIGRRIFEIDEDGFLSTTYFSQKDFQVKSNTSLTAKFNSLCESEDASAFDKALNKIEEKAKTYKYRGDKGLIADNKQQIFNINERIEKANKALLTSNTLKERRVELQKETEILKDKLNKLIEKEKLASKSEVDAIKREQYQTVSVEIAQLKKEKQEREKFLNGQATSIDELQAYQACVREIENISIREQDLINDIEQFSKPIISKSKTHKANIIYGAICATFLAVSIVLALTIGFLAVPTLVCFIGALVVSVLAIIIGTQRIKNVEKKDNRYLEIVQKKKEELQAYTTIKREYTDKVDAYISRFNTWKVEERSLALEQITKITIEISSLEKSIERAYAQLSILGKEQNFLQNQNACEINLDSVHAEKDAIQEEYDSKMRELTRNQANARYYDELSAILPELEEQKIQLIEKQAQYREDYELLSLTAELLKKADENLKIKYRTPLQDSLNKYLRFIAGENINAKIDIDLNITIEEKGAEKATDYYSKGYRNLFEICKRFALTDVLFKGEKPFVVLDDPFYNLDDGKLALSIELIKKLSNEYQIIYFVCHESRKG